MGPGPASLPRASVSNAPSYLLLRQSLPSSGALRNPKRQGQVPRAPSLTVPPQFSSKQSRWSGHSHLSVFGRGHAAECSEVKQCWWLSIARWRWPWPPRGAQTGLDLFLYTGLFLLPLLTASSFPSRFWARHVAWAPLLLCMVCHGGKGMAWCPPCVVSGQRSLVFGLLPRRAQTSLYLQLARSRLFTFCYILATRGWQTFPVQAQ